MRGYRAIAMILLAATCLFCGGCAKGNFHGASDEASETETEAQAETERIRYVYKTKYLDFDFISEEEMAEWKDSLVSLLNNEKTPIYDADGGVVDYSVLYPDRPCVENGYDVALFDLNTDGTPELLVNMGGGTAGNAFYYVYDLISGEEIGNMDGGHDNEWCVYFNHETGAYESIGQFEWRSGAHGKHRFVNRATVTRTMSWDTPYVDETSLLYAFYEIDAVAVDLTQEQKELGVAGAWKEIYPGVEFKVNGNHAYIEDYFEAQDHFTKTYLRISETGLRLIDWDDVTDETDDVATKAEKMAEALLSTGQRFVRPLEARE